MTFKQETHTYKHRYTYTLKHITCTTIIIECNADVDATYSLHLPLYGHLSHYYFDYY